MGDKTAIGWTDATWNPGAGCSITSPGCKNCYAMDEAARQIRCAAGLKRETHYAGTVQQVNGINVWTGQINPAPDHIWERPLHWKRPRRIFVNSMSDLFHENMPDELIDRAFAIMALSPQHTFQVLTKRSARMRAYMNDPTTKDRIQAKMWEISDRRTDHMRGGWPLRNVWLGVSCEDQQRADERIPDLLATPAAIRFISAEPLIGPISLRWAKWDDWRDSDGRGRSKVDHLDGARMLDWVIVGGESDRGSERARPMHPDWVRDIRDQCAEAGVPFFFKQWGEWAPGECASGPLTRTEQGAFWWDNRWLFESVTPSAAREMHRNDEPDVWRVGTRKARNTLDGKTHEQFPEVQA